MLSSLRVCRRGIAAAHNFGKSKFAHRNFMSESFRCNEAWNKRLSSPILQKVKVGDMFIEMDARLSETGVATAADIDIFANAITDDEHLDELDDLLHRFRMGTGSGNTLPSTHHAVVRAYLNAGETSELLRILNDRLNYGIFLDDYSNLLLMDHFVKKQDFASAAKIACMRMLQENFSHPLVNYVSLFACHKYLLSPTEWEAESSEPEADDGEEVKVRVKYLRNPYFDDHFDLKDPNALIGKTFHLMTLKMDDDLGKNYHALGLCLHKKWEAAENYVAAALKQGTKFYSSTIQLIDKFVGSLPEEEQKSLESLKIAITSARDSAVEKDLLAETTEKVKALVPSEEPKMIEEQCQAFVSWEDQRESVLKAELEELNRKQRLAEVEQMKQQLKKEEEEIFFFDNEDKMDIAIENKRVRYPKKWPGKKKRKREVGSEYVPPEITLQKPWSSQ
uniref:28S ribosomal protein S27, mitochondrial n=1 Tax=Lygus hesperus TaxID=30085 RepID=A0A146LW95_LYGHE